MEAIELTSQKLLFRFLSEINYNQRWDQVQAQIQALKNNYTFNSASTFSKIEPLAKMMWEKLQGHFDEMGEAA